MLNKRAAVQFLNLTQEISEIRIIGILSYRADRVRCIHPSREFTDKHGI